MSPGLVTFVAVAFDDPSLLTERAAGALAACDAVVHDEDVAPAVLARVRLEAERVAAPKVRTEAAALAAKRAERGLAVVRLTRDEILFGDDGEDEVEDLARRGIPFELVPAVPLESAVMAFGGFPLTRGSDISPSYAVVRARTEASLALHDWAALAHATDTLVVFTTRDTLGEVVSSLLYHARSPATPALAITGLGRPAQRVQQGVLSDIATRARRLPEGERVLVVGNVVERREVLRWFDARPLFGKRVLVTRAEGQARKTIDALRARGAEPVGAPAIALVPPPDPAPLRSALERLPGAYDAVAFTSANAVAFVWDELARRGRDARAFAGALLAAVGPGTARALEERGLRADVVAREFRGEGLAETLLHVAPGSRRLLLPRARIAREVVPETLRAAGWAVDVVSAYETKAPPPEAFEAAAAALASGAIDAVTFTSKSTVDHLMDALGGEAPRLLAKPKIAAIGPVTAEAAEARGLRVDVTASPHTIDALILALEASFR